MRSVASRLLSFVLLASFLSLNSFGYKSEADDTARLSFSTYLGSNSARGVAADSAGNIYITGEVRSAGISVTAGAAQTSFGGGEGDAFVIKLNPAGDQIIYATYIGGSGYDVGAGIAVDSQGAAYVTGTTFSDDFPTTPGAFQTGGRGPTVFVAKLNPSGRALSYSTFIGNGESVSGHDARAIAVDSEGAAYVTGLARENFPTTAGAFQMASGGGIDAFIAKLNATGSALVYSTFLGGPHQDIAQDIAVDSEGAAYVAGGGGPNFPTTAGALKRSGDGGDAFVTKLNPAGSALAYSTYLGGTGSEGAGGIAVDSEGAAYVTGSTSSDDFPTTEGAFLRISRGFGPDIFVTKLNAAGSNIVYSTFFGGSFGNTAGGIAVDSEGNAYITGLTSSVDMPVPRAFQRTNAGGPTFKTTNAAGDWSLINTGLSAAFVWDLTVDPSSTATLYALTSEGIFKSTDGGTTWAALNEALADFRVPSLAVDPLSPATLYAASRTGVFKSTDGGATWAISLRDFFAYVVEIDPANSAIVYAAARDVDGGGVARSTDAGRTWRFTRLPVTTATATINTLAIDPLNTSIIYVGTSRTGGEVYGTVFKSTDAGRSWTNTSLNVVDVHEVAVAPNAQGTVYAATGEGAFRSDDGGANWVDISGWQGGLPSSIVIDPVNPSIIYAGVERSIRAGVYKSTNGGTTWAATSLSNVSASAVAIDARNPSNIYAATSVGSDAFVAKFNSTGSALFYSTYLGGIADDALVGISLAVDPAGAAYIAGTTRSANFPTINAFKPEFSGQFSDAFAAKIESFDLSSAPIVTGVHVSGKKLIVSGENFSDRAAIVLGVESQKTANDEVEPNSKLIGKKAGKKIARGQTVSIQVRNSDGRLSEPFTFTRPVE